MDDPIAVRISQRVTKLLHDGQCMLQLHTLALDGSVERFTLDILHDDVRLAILIAGVVYDHDVVVAQCSRLGCLTVKPLQHVGIAAEALG